MPTCKTELEQRLYDALKRISRYETPERLMRNAMGTYGVSGEEAVWMAYENVREEAKRAVRNVRARKELPSRDILRAPIVMPGP